jgi:hypothetical protein
MRWCRCCEGQRVESWGCQGPSHTGLSIIHTTRLRLEVWGDLVYYESRKRKIKTRLICEYRCDERLKNVEKLKLRNLHASHALGWRTPWRSRYLRGSSGRVTGRVASPETYFFPFDFQMANRFSFNFKPSQRYPFQIRKGSQFHNGVALQFSNFKRFHHVCSASSSLCSLET